jgi:hypothetical protein
MKYDNLPQTGMRWFDEYIQWLNDEYCFRCESCHVRFTCFTSRKCLVLDKLTNCTDKLSESYCSAFGLKEGSTIADAVKEIRKYSDYLKG